MIPESIFHAYDIRGTYPEEVNEATFKRITQAYAHFLKPKTVAVGRDVRLSSESLHKAVIEGLTQSGVNVVDVGALPTDMLYFAVAYYHYDGGIQVTASHNPAQFNGMKVIRGGAEVVIKETGLDTIRQIASSDEDLSSETHGAVQPKEILEDYLDYIAQFAQFDDSRPLKIVANNNFGLTGPVAQALLKRLAAEHIGLLELNFEPDGSFPKGQPDPLLVKNREETSELIRETKADFGVAWDADGDRCFFADETGEFINGSTVTALLASELLARNPGEKILHDIRNIWAVEEAVRSHSGIPLTEKVGHGFFKRRMREEGALFGGEMSGHFYFRDYFGLDNGLIPFVLFLNLVAKATGPVSQLVAKLGSKTFVSGEINFKVEDKQKVIDKLADRYEDGSKDLTDGLTINFDDWRFNVRPSNNEPLLRLNVEARQKELCQQKTKELTDLISAS